MSCGAREGAGTEIGEAFGVAGPLRGARTEPVAAGSVTEPSDVARCSSTGLPAHDLLDLLLDLLLLEHVAARHPVDLGAHLGDAVLISGLHLRLLRDHPREHVVLEGEIGGGHHAPTRHDHEGADTGPECHRPEADLAATMTEE